MKISVQMFTCKTCRRSHNNPIKHAIEGCVVSWRNHPSGKPSKRQAR